MDWIDFNREGKVDAADDFDDVLEMAELDRSELEFMDEDGRRGNRRRKIRL